jgi:hypothetical protein
MNKTIYIIIGVIVCVLFFAIIKVTVLSDKVECGDNKCDTSENCATCSKDCGCAKGKVCKAGVCKTITCGDNVCDSNEVCCEDCGCRENEECNKNTHKCTKVIEPEEFCGDGKCSFGEDQWTCCVDCPCLIAGMICDEPSNSCVVVDKSTLTETEAKNIFKDHLLTLGHSQEDIDSYNYQVSASIESGKRVCYTKPADVVIGGCGIVYDDGSVSSLIYYS